MALAGDRSLRELTEIADKIVKVQLERSARRGRGAASSAGSSARSTSGSTPTGSPPTSSRSPPCATRWSAQNADMPGGNVTARHRASRRCARWGGVADPRAFNDLVVATVRRRTRSASATSAAPRTAPRSSARWRGSNGVPTRHPGGPPPVRREHRGGHRGGQGRPRARWPRSCRPTCGSRSSATSRATSTPPCTRSTIHLVLGSILACLVVLAFMRSWRSTHHRRRRDPGVGDRDVRR